MRPTSCGTSRSSSWWTLPYKIRITSTAATRSNNSAEGQRTSETAELRTAWSVGCSSIEPECSSDKQDAMAVMAARTRNVRFERDWRHATALRVDQWFRSTHLGGFRAEVGRWR